MRARDLLRLPLGQYSITDGIWNYQLRKCLTFDGLGIIYSFKELTSGQHFALLEEEDDVFNEPLIYGDYKQKILRVCMSVGGFSVHSKATSYSLYELKFIPKTNYTAWLKTMQLFNSEPTPERSVASKAP